MRLVAWDFLVGRGGRDRSATARPESKRCCGESLPRPQRSLNFPHPVTALAYPGAGHSIGTLQPYVSVEPDGFARYGGTTTGNEKALADAHTKLLRFLAQQ